MPDGSVRWHQWSDRAIFDESSTLVEYQSVGRDITDRKTAELDLAKKNEEIGAAYEQLTAIEEELRTSYDDLAASQRELETRELNLNAILQESPISQFVIDRNHKILYWNHALAVYSGIEAGEVVGTDQQWRAFYPDKRPCLADLVVENALDKIPEWYLDKYEKSVLIDDAYEATDFFPQTGKEGKWLHFTAGLIRDRNGDIIGAVESLEDVTGRKSAERELAGKNEDLHAAYEQLTAVEEELRTNFEDLVKSEHNLKDSEIRYRNVVEDQTEFICRFRPDGTHNFVNDAYCRYFGMQREQIIGHRFIPRIPEDDAGIIRSHFASLTRDRPLSTIEHRLIMPDGSVRWHQWSDRAIFDESGTLVEYQSVGRDITDRKTAELDLAKKNEEIGAAYEQLTAAEEELRQNYEELAKSQHLLLESEQKVRKSEAFLSSVINDAREGITACDHELRYILWNRFMENLTGIPAAEVLGKQATEMFPFLKEAGVDQLMQQALSGQTVESSDFSFRIDRTGRQGYVRAIYSPLSDAGGKVIGVIGIIQDTEARKVMEQALQNTIEQLMESEEKYRNVFNAKNDPLLLIDTRNRAIIDLNSAATDLYGYSREEMLELSLLALSAEPEKTEDALARRVPRVRMRFHRKKDGTVFSADISSAYFDLKGRPVLILSVRDLSSVQQIADALRLANVKLNLMIGITRHDVLNKLAVLIGYNDLLKDKIADTGTLEMLEKQEKALYAVRGQIEFTKEYDDLGVKSPLWQDAGETATRAYAQFMNTISFSCDTAHLELYADPMLEKVFYNLFDNAFRHGEGVSRIRIHCKKKGKDLCVFFEDDGVGIPDEYKEQIFSRGFGKNTGIGLYITREILGLTLIEIHETGTYRKGARFELRVPESSYRFLK
jgi:PAS domain S-box-containing protein